MFGHVMEFMSFTQNAQAQKIRLAPVAADEMKQFLGDQSSSWGVQSLDIGKFLLLDHAPTAEDQIELHGAIRNNPNSFFWGIYVQLPDETWKLIGNTRINNIRSPVFKEASTGILITDKAWWNKGITSACHRARLMYAFDELGIVCLRSEVFSGNRFSQAALERVGYVQCGVMRNQLFTGGRSYDKLLLELINPTSDIWAIWFKYRAATEQELIARNYALDALEWARKNVKFV